MVGGLVQHQQLRLGQQKPRQTESGLFTAGEQIRGLVFAAPRKAQTGQHALNPAGPLVAAGVLEAVHQPGVGLGELVESDGIVVLFGHLGLHIAQLALHFAHRFEHALQLLLDGQVTLDVRVLSQHAHARALHQRNRARVRLHHAGDQPEQRRFAAAVYADQPHAAARLKRQVHVLQHGVHGEGFGDILQGQ